MQRPHLGAVLLGPWDVVEVEGILRPDVAADVAVPQVNARALLLAVRVRE